MDARPGEAANCAPGFARHDSVMYPVTHLRTAATGTGLENWTSWRSWAIVASPKSMSSGVGEGRAKCSKQCPGEPTTHKNRFLESPSQLGVEIVHNYPRAGQL